MELLPMVLSIAKLATRSYCLRRDRTGLGPRQFSGTFVQLFMMEKLLGERDRVHWLAATPLLLCWALLTFSCLVLISSDPAQPEKENEEESEG